MISREEFAEIYQKYDKDCNVIEYAIEHGTVETDYFLFYYNFDYMELTIFATDRLDDKVQLVNWYKPYHLGRALNTVGLDDYEQVDKFMERALTECLDLIKARCEVTSNE